MFGKLTNFSELGFRFDGMDDRAKLCRLLDFVALELTNEVPANVVRECFGLRNQLLKSAFAKVPLSKIVQFPNNIDWLGLGNGDQRNARWVAGDQRAISLDFLLNRCVP